MKWLIYAPAAAITLILLPMICWCLLDQITSMPTEIKVLMMLAYYMAVMVKATLDYLNGPKKRYRDDYDF